MPDFRDVLETEDGAAVLFAWRGLRRRADSGLELVGSMTHVSDDDRYAWLNDRVCAVSGEVQTRADGPGFNVVLDIAELAWEPLGPSRHSRLPDRVVAALRGRAN